jgi:hypothetical protein
MSRSAISRGSEVELSVTFYNASQELADPDPLTSLSVSVYPPDHDPRLEDEDANAWVKDATLSSAGTGVAASGLIEHIGTGKFLYTLTVPVAATVGTAFDRWEAIVNLESLDEVFTFNVIAGATAMSTQIYNNNAIFVKLYDVIASTEGDTLAEHYEWYFTTTYDPLYTSVKRIRLELGNLITDVPDDTINLAIFEASIEANALTFATTTVQTASVLRFFQFARRQYVTCLAEIILLSSISSSSSTEGGKSKRLADLQISYGNGGQFDDLLDKAMACRIKWEATLTSSGEIGPGTSQRPSMVIKGELDPDRPLFGRDWEPTSTHSGIGSEYPAANAKARSVYARRWRKNYFINRWSSRYGGTD